MSRRRKAIVDKTAQLRAQAESAARDNLRKQRAAERRQLRTYRREDHKARFWQRLQVHGFAAAVATTIVAFAGPESLGDVAAAVGIGLVVLIGLLFLVDVITGQSHARLPRLFGVPAAFATTAFVLFSGPPIPGLFTSALALAPPAGWLGGYAVGSVLGRIAEISPPAANSSRLTRWGAAIGLLPAAAGIGALIDLASWLGISTAQLPGPLSDATVALESLAGWGLPGPLVFWLAPPVAVCLVWFYDQGIWSRLGGAARVWLAAGAALCSLIPLFAVPQLTVMGLFFGAPLLLVLLIILSTWRPNPPPYQPLPQQPLPWQANPSS